MKFILSLIVRITLDGKLQPVLFGIEYFSTRTVDCFVSIAPSPRPKESETRLVDPKEERCQVCV
jgi:peptide chain release factor 3